MTVAECLKDWLNGFDSAVFEDIDIDMVESENGSYSISKSPNKTVTPYNDGSSLVTEYYQFFARQASQLNEQRIDNMQLLSDFEDWIEDKDFNGEYPVLPTKYTCQEIGVNSSASITSVEEDNAIYQITIAITYLKER